MTPWLTPLHAVWRQVRIGRSAVGSRDGMVSPVAPWLAPSLAERRQVRIGRSAMAPQRTSDYAYLASPGAVKAWRFHRPLASRVAKFIQEGC